MCIVCGYVCTVELFIFARPCVRIRVPQVEQETSMIGSEEGLHMTIDPFMADVISKSDTYARARANTHTHIHTIKKKKNT